MSENAVALQIGGSVEILPKDVFKWLQSPAGEEFDLIFADPPYDDARTQMELPAMIFSGGWLAPTGLCVIEHRAGEPAIPPVGAKIIRELNAGEAGFTILTHETKEADET